MTTTTVTLKVDVTDDGYHQTTTRKLEVHGLALDAVHDILLETEDQLRGQSQLPLDAGDADPAYVTNHLHAVPDPDVQDVIAEHETDICICAVDAVPDPECPVHGHPDPNAS